MNLDDFAKDLKIFMDQKFDPNERTLVIRTGKLGAAMLDEAIVKQHRSDLKKEYIKAMVGSGIAKKEQEVVLKHVDNGELEFAEAVYRAAIARAR